MPKSAEERSKHVYCIAMSIRVFTQYMLPKKSKNPKQVVYIS